MPLVTLADIREHVPALKNLADDKLERLRTRAEVAIARRLDVYHDLGSTPSLDSATRTVYLDGPKLGEPEVVDLWGKLGVPVTAITSVAEDEVLDRTWGSAVASTDYELVENRTLDLVPSQGHAWLVGRRSIQVVCTAGYSTSSPPADLVDAILLTIEATWKGRAGRTGQAADPGADVLTIRVRIPTAALVLLAPFERYSGAAG